MGRDLRLAARTRGALTARLCRTPDDFKAALALRALSFGANNADAFDARCQHVLIESTGTAGPVCVFRLAVSALGADILSGYCAQFYDLSALAQTIHPLIEIGRFCLHPAWHDPNTLRLAWGTLAQIVADSGAVMLFGCSSFPGADPARHAQAFRLLHDRYIGPANLVPALKSPAALRLSTFGGADVAGRAQAQQGLPPLVRSYLRMGGWVGDHVVPDTSMNTVHVFTALPVATVPPLRARSLRRITA